MMSYFEYFSIIGHSWRCCWSYSCLNLPCCWHNIDRSHRDNCGIDDTARRGHSWIYFNEMSNLLFCFFVWFCFVFFLSFEKPKKTFGIKKRERKKKQRKSTWNIINSLRALDAIDWFRLTVALRKIRKKSHPLLIKINNQFDLQWKIIFKTKIFNFQQMTPVIN